MEIRITYKGTLNGVKGVWCGFKPDGAIITEEKLVLMASAGYKLKNKETEETCHSVIIQTPEEQDNWEEVEREKFPWEKEKDNG